MPDPDASFMNPLPPTARAAASAAIYEDDDAHPLSNEDFRKLMMTPKVPFGTTPHRHHASGVASASGGERRTSSDGAAFARPRPVAPSTMDENDPSYQRRKKKSYYAQLKKEEERREKELAELYRDRARERRDGVNKETDAPAAESTTSTTADYRAVAPDAKVLGDDYSERRKKVIQESKYLGGDMEHTHLVKGLDYALLEKVKAEITNKEQEEEQMEAVVSAKKPERELGDDAAAAAAAAVEEQMQFRTRLGRNVFRTLFRSKPPDRNDLFLPGRMAYVIDLEDESFGDMDVPTTLIRSKADCPSLESTTTLTNNDIVINKLTQILSYLRQGRRDRKKKKGKAGAAGGAILPKDDERLKALASMDIYSGLGTDHPRSKGADISSGMNKDRRGGDGRDSGKGERGSHQGGRYFEKPTEDEMDKGGLDGTGGTLPTNAKDLVMSINSRFAGGGGRGWEGGEEGEAGGGKQTSREEERLKRLKSKNEIDSYAECYPGMAESADAIDDSDEEADYTKMDQGNKKGPVGRWDFDTQEEYSSYMSTKEALPKAAFQYGVKMSDGRKTRRAGTKDEKKELDKEWQQIQNIIRKRKGDGPGGEPGSKRQA